MLYTSVYLIKVNELDVCAKKQYWEFIEHLLSSGMLGVKLKDFEANKSFVFFLRKQLKNEKNEIVLEIAKRVFSKINNYEKIEAEKKLKDLIKCPKCGHSFLKKISR